MGADDKGAVVIGVLLNRWEKEELRFLEMNNVGLKNRKLGK